MTLDLANFKDRCLREKSRASFPIDFDAGLPMRMVEVMTAPQVGYGLRLFIMSTSGSRDRAQIIINPRIARHGSDFRTEHESCLRCSGERVLTARWRVVDVEYLDQNGILITDIRRV